MLNNILNKLFLLGLISLLSACNPPQVDTSTDENMNASIKKVKNSLPDSKCSATIKNTGLTTIRNAGVN